MYWDTRAPTTAAAMPSPMIKSTPRVNQSGSRTIDHGQLMTPPSLSPISVNSTTLNTPPTGERHWRRETDTRGPDTPSA
jgi:hypothetical protein